MGALPRGTTDGLGGEPTIFHSGDCNQLRSPPEHQPGCYGWGCAPLEALAATQPLLDAFAPTPQPKQALTPGLARKGLTNQHRAPIAYCNVYVDDFILVAHTIHHRQGVLGSALHPRNRFRTAFPQPLRPPKPERTNLGQEAPARGCSLGDMQDDLKMGRQGHCERHLEPHPRPTREEALVRLAPNASSDLTPRPGCGMAPTPRGATVHVGGVARFGGVVLCTVRRPSQGQLSPRTPYSTRV